MLTGLGGLFRVLIAFAQDVEPGPLRVPGAAMDGLVQALERGELGLECSLRRREALHVVVTLLLRLIAVSVDDGEAADVTTEAVAQVRGHVSVSIFALSFTFAFPFASFALALERPWDPRSPLCRRWPGHCWWPPICPCARGGPHLSFTFAFACRAVKG